MKYDEYDAPYECYGNGGFLSGDDEPMNIHRHWIEPGRGCCGGANSSAQDAIYLVSGHIETMEVAAGGTVALPMDSHVWGNAMSWVQAEHCVLFQHGGLYCIHWQVPIGTNGVWPVVITLEDQYGKVYATGANIGVTVTGDYIGTVNAMAKLRLVNRSAGTLRLVELCSGTACMGSTWQGFRL